MESELCSMVFLLSAVEALLLVTALSTDAFVSGFAYGANKIKIPLSSVLLIDVIGTVILTASLLFGRVIGGYLPEGLTMGICVCILFGLGLSKIFDSGVKSLIRRHRNFKRKIKFSICSLGFVLSVYADPEKADQDSSRVLSPAEAAYLAVALSLDSFAVGFGAGVSDINLWMVITLSLLTDLAGISLGSRLGNRLAQRCSLNLSWLGGVLLIILAILKLL